MHFLDIFSYRIWSLILLRSHFHTTQAPQGFASCGAYSPDRIGNPIRSGLCCCSCTVSVSVTRYADFHHSQRWLPPCTEQDSGSVFFLLAEDNNACARNDRCNTNADEAHCAGYRRIGSIGGNCGGLIGDGRFGDGRFADHD